MKNPVHNLVYRGLDDVVAWIKKSAICHSREGGNPEKTLKISKII